MKRFLSCLSALMILFLCGCTRNAVENKVTEILLPPFASEIELKIGEVSKQNYVTVLYEGQVSPNNFEVFVQDKTIARAKIISLLENRYIVFSVEGLKDGETELYISDESALVKSEKMSVIVTEKSQTEVETETELESKTETETRTETETQATQVNQNEVSTAQNDEKTDNEVSSDRKVYITKTGSKYHFSATCAGKVPIETTLSEAKKNYSACKKCAGG